MSADISIKRYQNMQMHAYIFKKTNSAKAFQEHCGRKTTVFFYYCRPVKNLTLIMLILYIVFFLTQKSQKSQKRTCL